MPSLSRIDAAGSSRLCCIHTPISPADAILTLSFPPSPRYLASMPGWLYHSPAELRLPPGGKVNSPAIDWLRRGWYRESTDCTLSPPSLSLSPESPLSRSRSLSLLYIPPLYVFYLPHSHSLCLSHVSSLSLSPLSLLKKKASQSVCDPLGCL